MSGSVSEPFFFFGCWNRDNCDEKDNMIDHRGMVLKLLKQKEGEYTFGIIAGDNAYPVPSPEGKKYYRSTLETGFKGLRNATAEKEKHVILGNHNVESGLTDLKQVGVLQAQQALLQSDDYNKLFTLYGEPAKHVNIKNNDFVFLNTNVYTPGNQAIWEEPLRNALQSCGSGIVYIVGHEPLMAAKVKKGKFFTHLDVINEVFDVIKKSNKKCIYLCADVHNFQALTIKRDDDDFVLPIIVCGTGGAEPDVEELKQCYDEHIFGIGDRNIKPTKKVGDRTYMIDVKLLAPPYGFCVFKNNLVTYHTINSETVQQTPITLDKGINVTVDNSTTLDKSEFEGKGCQIVLATKPPKPEKQDGGRRRVIIE